MGTLKPLILSLALLGVGCATANTASSQTPPANPDRFKLADGTIMECQMESMTGTHIREKVCHRVEGTSAQKRQAIDEVLNQPIKQVLPGG